VTESVIILKLKIYQIIKADMPMGKSDVRCVGYSCIMKEYFARAVDTD